MSLVHKDKDDSWINPVVEAGGCPSVTKESAKETHRSLEELAEKLHKTRENTVPNKTSAMAIQVGGSHYKDFKPEPFEFFHTNNIPFHKADIIKRILRYDKPTGKGHEDLRKIIHECQMIMELEKRPPSDEIL